MMIMGELNVTDTFQALIPFALINSGLVNLFRLMTGRHNLLVVILRDSISVFAVTQEEEKTGTLATLMMQGWETGCSLDGRELFSVLTHAIGGSPQEVGGLVIR